MPPTTDARTARSRIRAYLKSRPQDAGDAISWRLPPQTGPELRQSDIEMLLQENKRLRAACRSLQSMYPQQQETELEQAVDKFLKAIAPGNKLSRIKALEVLAAIQPVDTAKRIRHIAALTRNPHTGNSNALPSPYTSTNLDTIEQYIKEQADVVRSLRDLNDNAINDYGVLRERIRELADRYLTFLRSEDTSIELLNKLEKCIQLPPEHLVPTGGVGEILAARNYQLSQHPDTGLSPEQRQDRRIALQAAAVALLTGTEALYPFGKNSWRGVAKRGRRQQLAHAGACIAAVLDLGAQEFPPGSTFQKPGTAIWTNEAADFLYAGGDDTGDAHQ